MNNRFYVTTPIYYVNDSPHIGHTGTTLIADILARYAKLNQQRVFFLTGTDEHGAKVAEAASEKGLAPQQYCDQVAQTYAEIWPKLDIEYDYFIRTTNPDHVQIVQEVLQKIYQKGEIYKSQYEGLYCIGCEKFITESELENNRCPLHPNREVAKQTEDNYFFRLAAYVPVLIQAIEDPGHPQHYEIYPESKKNEVLARLKAGVTDISISRTQVTWGVPIPWDRKQTIYVWVDALLNYYTALRITNQTEFWPTDLHVVGKEILWFHTVIWQALLLAADLPLPKKVFVHSFYMIDGQKMSKSLGNVITPQALLGKYGVDGTRYLIASSFPTSEDSDIGWERLTQRYNADLANGLGNLVARVARLAEKTEIGFPAEKETGFDPELAGKLEKYQFAEALAVIWQKIAAEDKRINQAKPWQLSPVESADFLKTSIQTVRKVAFSLQPFLPHTATKIRKQFQGPKIKSAPALFPRI